MPNMSLDSELAPELVEFWGRKYQFVKEELEKLKEAYEVKAESRQESTQENAILKDLVDQLQKESAKREEGNRILQDMVQSARKEEAAMKSRLTEVEKERNELVVCVAKLETEHAALAQQAQVFYTQTAELAKLAHQQRMSVIAASVTKQDFLPDPSFEPTPVKMTDPHVVLPLIPSALSNANPCYFLPRPPSSLPLQVPAHGQAGYWFHPSYVMPADSQFELIVEGHPGEWSYLGRYVHSLLRGHEMRLSEWMALDEQTKLYYSMRIASQALPQGQVASYPSQLETKRRFESGESAVPCYMLRCVGFNVPLYKALWNAAVKLVLPVKVPLPGVGVISLNTLPSRASTDPASSMPQPSQEGDQLSGPGKRRRSGSENVAPFVIEIPEQAEKEVSVKRARSMLQSVNGADKLPTQTR